MNHSYTRASDAVSADAASTRAFLQQAIDHYPRLAAFSFTLAMPCREAMSEYRSLILRFHTVVWQRTGEYSRQRQQARRHSPPTILRWMWESASAPECKMVLLMNIDTIGGSLDEVVWQEMNGLLREAWRTVTHADSSVTSMLSFFLCRNEGCSFTRPFSQLQTRVNEMVSPLMTARTGVACP
ncbi:DUF3296 domain-containing protein [Enterobacter cloacae]